MNALHVGSSRVPYRDSKLTRLLQDSLGGTANAVLIANVSSSPKNFQETCNTLNFAAKSKTIVNKPVVFAEDFRDPKPKKESKFEPNLKDNLVSKYASLYGNNSREFVSKLEEIEKIMRKNTGEKNSGKQVFDPQVLLTPFSRADALKELVKNAKALAKEGDLLKSLSIYQIAHKFADEDQKGMIQRKIDDIRSNKSDSKKDKEARKLEFEEMEEVREKKKAKRTFSESVDQEDKENKPNASRSKKGVRMGEKVVLELLNNASEKKLVELREIGKKRAQTIVEYRKYSPLEKLEDLMKVPGFSAKLLSSFLEKNVQSD